MPYLHPNGPHWVNCFVCNNPIIKCDSIEDHNTVKDEFLHCEQCSEDHCIVCKSKVNTSSRNILKFFNKKVKGDNKHKFHKATTFITAQRPKMHP